MEVHFLNIFFLIFSSVVTINRNEKEAISDAY